MQQQYALSHSLPSRPQIPHVPTTRNVVDIDIPKASFSLPTDKNKQKV